MGFFSFAIWGADLLRFEEDVAALVLASHPTGYSTTTHDLIHDLIL